MAKETPVSENRTTSTKPKTFDEAAKDAPKTEAVAGDKKQSTTTLEEATKVGYLGDPKDTELDYRHTFQGVTGGKK